jgi:tetratricopeptide (TPR) repeat protein
MIGLKHPGRTVHRWSWNLASLRLGVFVFAFFAMNCSAWMPSAAESGTLGRAALRSGDYAAARNHFESALKSNPGLEESQAGLLETLRQTGAYAEAEGRADGFLKIKEESVLVHLARGRIAEERGQFDDAELHFRRSIALPATQSGASHLTAMKELASLLEIIGRRDEANSLWDQVIDEYRRGRIRGSDALGSAAVAAWHRGYAQDAKDIFIDATGGKAGSEVPLEVLSDFGYLFLEKYNATDAMGVFRDCLKINKVYPAALVGMALAKQYESSSEVETFARAALAVNPNFVPAITLLAELRIEEEDYNAAAKELQRALAINPASLETLALQAVCQQLRGDAAGFSATEKQVLGINSTYGRFYHTLAENLVRRRKYREAVGEDRHAIALDPRLWPAQASLGMNLMRIGDLSGGRSALQRAFDGDPFNVWAFNTLDLLDQMDKFVRTKSEHFVYLMAKEDQPSLSQYAPRIAEEAYQQLTRRYGFKPEGPLQVEIFPDHGGFAVRTLGLPGLGALGVCFGKVVAIDSPRARKAESFNWGSTLWHELAHVITLQMTNHNIPRWYSEGLSVHEERRARPGWGDHLTLEFVRAYKEGKLLKVSELNAGMMRPKSPEQIELSYYQAALFCELIEEKFGFEKIRQSLQLFAANTPPESVFRDVLGWDTARLDAEYARYIESRLREVASHLHFPKSSGQKPHADRMDRQALSAALAKDPDDFMLNLQMGIRLHEEKADREAESYLKKAEALFPQFVGPGSPYEILSSLYLEEKREDEALAQLLGWTRYDGNAAGALGRAAEIYRKRKEWTATARLLDLSLYIQPYDPQTYITLGEVSGEAGDWSGAASAYQVLVDLDPPDPAGAHYSLARAWLGLGKTHEAKREVLRALEIAPTFEKAQALLLKLSGGQP